MLTTEKGYLTDDKKDIEAVRDSFINPEDGCGIKLFGMAWCKVPKAPKEEE